MRDELTILGFMVDNIQLIKVIELIKLQIHMQHLFVPFVSLGAFVCRCFFTCSYWRLAACILTPFELSVYLFWSLVLFVFPQTSHIVQCSHIAKSRKRFTYSD